MVGIMIGFMFGVVIVYILGIDLIGFWFFKGDMIVCWVFCLGVFVVDIKVDDNYSLKCKVLG